MNAVGGHVRFGILFLLAMYLQCMYILEVNQRRHSMKTTTLAPIRINPETKEEAGKILASMGLTTSAAVTLFLNQVIVEKGLPFKPSLAPQTQDNPEFQTALEDVIKRYDSAFQILAK